MLLQLKDSPWNYPGGGGGALGYRGGPHLRCVFRGRRGLFLRPPHVRDFVKEGYFLPPPPPPGELFVKRREFIHGSRFLSRHDMT